MGVLFAPDFLRGTHAVGVECVQNGQVMRAEAAGEGILCAGTFNTPQLLMLSGIGPAEHLRGVDIASVVDLPVGRNLQDHLTVFINFARPAAGPFRRAMRADRMALAMAQAYLFGTGPGTVVPGGLHAFVKTRRIWRCQTSSSCSAAHRPTFAYGFRWSNRPMRTALPSGRRSCIPTVAARYACALPTRAIRPKSSEIFCRRQAICRACARVFAAPARLPGKSHWSRFAVSRPDLARRPGVMPTSMPGSGARPSRRITGRYLSDGDRPR